MMVVISFARFYQKTKRNIRIAGEENGFTWSDPADEWKNGLARDLSSIAAAHRMRLTVCGQPQHVPEIGGEARCVDANRLAEVACQPVKAPMTMIPSIPRFSTPARSQISSPIVAKIRGEAMRIAAAQKLVEIKMSHSAIISTPLGSAPVPAPAP